MKSAGVRTARMRHHAAGRDCSAVSVFCFTFKERRDKTEMKLFSRYVVLIKIQFYFSFTSDVKAVQEYALDCD